MKIFISKLTDTNKSWFFDFYEDYSQFFTDCNWYTYRLAHVEFEDDKIMGGYEITVIILGLGFRFRYNHTETEQMTYCKKAVEEIKAGTISTRPFSDLKKELFEDE